MPALLILMTWPLLAQVNTGELRLKVIDPTGLGLQAMVTLSSDASEYHHKFVTDDNGTTAVETLSYGIYRLDIEKLQFLWSTRPASVLAAVSTEVKVSDADTLIDPNLPSSIMQIGAQQIEDRPGSLPGRSVQDLVNSQPGWLYEGNAVLHPRGSEYQTQFVVDGIPLTDNRSPGFGPEIEADDLDSVNTYTAGFPAEYGRKLGGVVELNTSRQVQSGVHGQLVLSGGSYDTTQGFGQLQDTWGKNTLLATASGSGTSHYLNPVVPENFTNNGTTRDFSLRYERTSPRATASPRVSVTSSPDSKSPTS